MLLTVTVFFLILRVILRFFSANPTTPFVEWILSISSFLIRPFAGIVPNVVTQTGVLDVVALISLIVYLIAGYFLLNILEGLTTRTDIVDEEYPTIAHYHDIPKNKAKGRGWL